MTPQTPNRRPHRASHMTRTGPRPRQSSVGPLFPLLCTTAFLNGNHVKPCPLATEENDLRALMRNVDMVTLTIGGNDAGFAKKIEDCVKVVECDPTVADARLAQIEQSVVDCVDACERTRP